MSQCPVRVQERLLPPEARRAAAPLLVALLTFLAFAGSMKAGFVNWDDDVYVYESSLIQHPSWDGGWRILSRPHATLHLYVPLVFLSYCADSVLWRAAPVGFHLTNVALHCASGVLVFFLCRRLFSSTAIAFVAALIHQVHPLRVESVTWVTERKDTLCLFFYVLSALLYLRYRAGQGRYAYPLSVTACLLAMLSKLAAVTLPFLLLLVEWHLFGKVRLRDKWPYLVVVGVCAALNGAALVEADVIRPLDSGGLLGRAVVVARLFLFYLAKAALPTRLSCYYVFPHIGQANVGGILSALGVAALGAACAYGLWRRRPVAFGLAAFGLLLAPAAHLIPAAIPALVAADRHTYLASLGLAAMAALGACSIRRFPNWRNACVIFGLSLSAALTLQRIPAWQSGETLWADALRKGSFSSAAYGNYAAASLSAGRRDRARDMAHRALTHDPKSPTAHNLLGHVFRAENQMPEAARCYRLAAYSPKSLPTDHFNLGFALMAMGEAEDALKELNTAIARDPELQRAHLALGDLHFSHGRLAESEAAYRRAISLSPGDAEPRLGLARVLERRGAMPEAERECRTALERNPESVTGLNQLAALLARQRRADEAEALLRRALGLNPVEPGTYVNLGNVLVQRNRLEEAAGMYRTALRLDPQRQNARQNLANLLRLMGKPAD